MRTADTEITKKIVKRQHKLISFDPPFLKTVKMNTGKKLIDHHFPKHHRILKLFDKNKIKLRYSCCRNLDSVIVPIIKELFKRPLITMRAIINIEPSSILIINV